MFTLFKLMSVAAAVYFNMTWPAEAYLDAPSASMIIQVIVGGIVGFAVMLKYYWHKIKGFLLRSPSENSQASDGPEN